MMVGALFHVCARERVCDVSHHVFYWSQRATVEEGLYLVLGYHGTGVPGSLAASKSSLLSNFSERDGDVGDPPTVAARAPPQRRRAARRSAAAAELAAEAGRQAAMKLVAASPRKACSTRSTPSSRILSASRHPRTRYRPQSSRHRDRHS